MATNIILQGPPGSGKTTAVEAIVSRLPEGVADGFLTREIRSCSVRTGFEIIDLRGHKGLLAHVNVLGNHRVGRYGVDVSSFERIAVAAIERALTFGQIVVIDEIGRMELFSHKFQTVVREAMDSSPPVIASMMIGRHPFVDRARERDDVEIVELTPANRILVPRRVLRSLGFEPPAPPAAGATRS